MKPGYDLCHEERKRIEMPCSCEESKKLTEAELMPFERPFKEQEDKRSGLLMMTKFGTEEISVISMTPASEQESEDTAEELTDGEYMKWIRT
ncbi:hypothetical protein FQR65_LT18337 [Abscondita terminalis]|nr:hypothetical protein FQR65_LT18337 [Abscondita terminalis]